MVHKDSSLLKYVPGDYNEDNYNVNVVLNSFFESQNESNKNGFSILCNGLQLDNIDFKLENENVVPGTSILNCLVFSFHSLYV